jgi:hypothetical protein
LPTSSTGTRQLPHRLPRATKLRRAAAQQFDTTIARREDAARRLGRELDLAVERFVREAEGVLASASSISIWP